MNGIIAALREIPLMLKTSPAALESGFRFSLIDRDIPIGSLIEVSGGMGSGKTEAVLRMLSENPTARVGWVEENLTIYPVVFPQSRVKLDRMLFVDATEESEAALWSVQRMVASEAFDIVVMTAYDVSELALRRLQLAAERSKTTVILVRDEPSWGATWPLTMQLAVERVHGELEVSIVRQRVFSLRTKA
jgi:hypothetical protein